MSYNAETMVTVLLLFARFITGVAAGIAVVVAFGNISFIDGLLFNVLQVFTDVIVVIVVVLLQLFVDEYNNND